MEIRAKHTCAPAAPCPPEIQGRGPQGSRHPSPKQRAAFEATGVRLRARGNGSHHAWKKIGQNPRFWTRLNDAQRARVARTLSTATGDTSKAAATLSAIIDSPLFADASSRGRTHALTDVRNAFLHVDRSPTSQNLLPFPTRAEVAKHADYWKRQHTSHMTPMTAEITHGRVLRELAWFRTHFFEPIAGTQPPKMWGDVYSQTPGRSWYRTMMNIQRAGGSIAACRSAFRMAGVTRGADQVCGHPR